MLPSVVTFIDKRVSSWFLRGNLITDTDLGRSFSKDSVCFVTTRIVEIVLRSSDVTRVIVSSVKCYS